MASTATPSTSPGDQRATAADAAEIQRLQETLALQRQAFLREPYPSLDERRQHLGALAGAVISARPRIQEAMRSDFAAHPDVFTDLVEVLGVAGRAAYAIEHLEEWASPQSREVDPTLYGSAQAQVRYQPKGVVGNIVPWNFPFDLSLGPLVEMLAAGNRVVMKPSEYTPACGGVLRELVSSTFDREHVDVAVGGPDLARQFPTLRWDHLLYTGSPAVGRLIARAAAENLVPVTLELGGKCPALIGPDRVDERTVREVLGVKLVKSGQMCITIDYCLVPRGSLEQFVDLARNQAGEQLSEYSRGPDCTGIITEHHLDRLLGLLAQARDAGATLVGLEPGREVERAERRMPLTLVIDPPAELELMQEEIFGPILPVVPYDDVDAAIAYVNERERPLALYVYSDDPETSERVLQRTVSGGACVNASATHGSLPSLAFGGIGQSGSGRHHGVEGFREFSNPRGVFVRGEGDLLDAFLPPYCPQAQAIVGAAFGQAGAEGP